MQASFQGAGAFLIQTLFDLYIFIVLLRYMSQVFNANFYNPIVQALIKVTDPVLQPIRRIIPNYRRIDLAIMVLLLGLGVVKILLLIGFVGAVVPSISSLFVAAIAGVLYQLTQLFFFAILIWVIISWVSPQSRHPGVELLYQLTEPLLHQARRFIPSLGGLDFSPFIVLVALKLISFFVLYPWIVRV